MRAHSFALLAALLATGCIEHNLIDCGNGVMCAADRACAVAQRTCVDPGQIDACESLAHDDACTTPEIPDGICRDGVCFPVACGNDYLEPGELCDDGNAKDGDGCRNDCLSDGLCGGGVIDPGETCDDRNLISHDGCDSSCSIETLTWTRRDQVAPPPVLSSPAAAYDAARGLLVLVDTRGIFYWDGNAWFTRSGPQPPARLGGAMTYDSKRRRIVLVGGRTSAVALDDMWIWDGERWTEHGFGPGARWGHSLVFDAARDRVVLFGGQRDTGALDDVWEWDGATWMQVTTTGEAPTARYDHAATYDPERAQVVIAGGSDTWTTPLAETWLYDGAWTRGPDTVAPIGRAALSYSPVLAASVLTGEGNVWTWNGSAWTELATTAMLQRHVSYFDAAKSSTALFGSDTGPRHRLFNEATTAEWSDIAPAPVLPRIAAQPFHWDTARKRGVLFDGTPFGTRQTWELVGATWQLRPTTTAPPSGSGFASAYDESRKVTVMFGGQQADQGLYEWNGELWTRRTIEGAPIARTGTAMVFHATRGVAVMFGGSYRNLAEPQATTLADSWLWNGTSWQQTGDGPPRYHHQMVYDARRGTVVMFGGIDGSLQYPNDVWEWDGAWKRIEVTGAAPRGRVYFAMAYDADRNATIVRGGSSDGTELRDTWAWDGHQWQELPVAGNPSARPGATMIHDPLAHALIGVDLTGAWTLRWESERGIDELCSQSLDLDEDGLVGCGDPDCAAACR